MDKRKLINLTLIAMIVGFMIAIQLQTVKEPVIRDTRDTWEIREALLKEKDRQYALMSEVESNEDKITRYENERAQSKEQVLRETLEELKVEAGLTEVRGNGLKLYIEPTIENISVDLPITQVSPDHLKKLINELNMYGANYIAIDNQRYINSTAIRVVNNVTKVNGQPLNRMPLEILVIVDDHETAEKLYNRMKVSKSADAFFVENLRLVVSKPVREIIIPAYQDPIRVRYMKAVEE